MNLTKEQLQRGFLGLIMVLLAIYAYATMLLGPLSSQEAAAQTQMRTLEPKIKQAKIQLNRTRSIKEGDAHAGKAESIRKVIEEKIPQEAAIVWLPQQVLDLFRMHEITNATASPQGSLPDEDLPGFVASRWSVDISSVRYHDFAEALADLENHFGLAQIQSVSIRAQSNNVEQQSINITFSTVTRP